MTLSRSTRDKLERDGSLRYPMRCPNCGEPCRTVDSRGGPSNTVRRRRHCMGPACLHRFTTYEIVVAEAPVLDLEVLVDTVTKQSHQAIEAVRKIVDTANAAKFLLKAPKS